jgi:ATP-dependent Lon protease
MMSAEDTRVLPILPIKNTVLYPYLLMPLSVGRRISLAAVGAAVDSEDKTVVIVAQKDAEVEEPVSDDLYRVGTEAVIKRMERTDQGVQMVVQGLQRVELLELEQVSPFLRARVRVLPEPQDANTEVEALHRTVLEQAERIQSLTQQPGAIGISQIIAQVDNPLHRVYLLASMLSLSLEKEQALLEASSRADALRMMHDYLTHEVQVLELRQRITSQAASEMSREQREYLLRRQMEAIQEELGETNPEKAALAELRDQLQKTQLPDDVRKELERELNRLERLNVNAPDYQMTRGYMEFALELPWAETTEDNQDLGRARQVLDEDHYDLDDVKRRIIEHLAVMKLNPRAKAPIICFVGPPGVGKTSLGQSIARSLGRKFERMSLGGMHDEAELRGHRRTYIGAMPGRILQAVRRAGVKNPVLMLDEVDKLGRDFRGDPASALLEILDPAQNHDFRDNYLNLPFDLSGIFFITTANTLDTIPRPLLDRMEVIRLAGYSEEEKRNIARRYLIPRRIEEAGLREDQLHLPDETLRQLIGRYTREAGVRQLERVIGTLARKVAVRFAEGHQEPVTIEPDQLLDMLGPEPFILERARQHLPPGVATGMAWTESGGEVLYIEVALLPEGKELILTGHLGDVMRESAQAARSYIWSQAENLGVQRDQLRNTGVHIHVPAGAIPKDGPSAGLAMAVALASAYSGHSVRSDTSMTGEITLAGLVLPVGGIKEKVLAARRAGIRRVVLPAENRKDLRDLPDDVAGEFEFVFVRQVEEALAATIPELAERLALEDASV